MSSLFTPQVRYGTATGFDTDDDKSGQLGFVFLQRKENLAAAAELIPSSNFFAAGDITPGDTNVQEGDIFIAPNNAAERLSNLTGLPVRWAWPILLTALAVLSYFLYQAYNDNVR